MKRDEILQVIKDLAKSQGFYGRLYRSIMQLETPDFEDYMKLLESKNFKTTLELIMYFEC